MRQLRLDQSRGKQFPLKDEFFRQVIVEVDEEFALGNELVTPFAAIEFHDRFEVFLGEAIEILDIEVLIIGNPSDLGFVTRSGTFAAFYDPFEDAHILTEAGPHEFSVLGFAEPVDVEKAWEVG